MKSILGLTILLSLPVAAHAAPLYVRASAGREASGDATVRDRDCSSTQPPALFGCVAGNDGRALGARGDFGEGSTFAVAVGTRLGFRGRAELELALHPHTDLDARANFLGVRGIQPVTADGRSTSALLIGAFDLTRGDARPFVLAGIGAARNEIDDVTYAFPSIAPEAVTITSDGSRTGIAWTAGVGMSMDVSPALAIEVALRYTDLGTMETEAGEATIVRPNRRLTLDIAGTEADLRTLGVSVGLRFGR